MSLSQKVHELAMRLGEEVSTLNERVDSVDTYQASVSVSAPGSRASVIAKDTAYTVPIYTVGAHNLQIFLNGILCESGNNANTCAYYEVGTSGASSTTIKFHQAIPMDVEIIARV